MSECDSSQLASLTGDTGQQPPSTSEPSAPETLPLQPQPTTPNVILPQPDPSGPDVISPYPQPNTDALRASPGPALATTGPPSYGEVIKHQQQQPGAHPVQPEATYPLQQGASPSQQGVYPLQQGMYPPQQNVYPHQLGAAPVQPVQPQSAHQSLGTTLVYTESQLTRPQGFVKRNRALKCIICAVVMGVMVVIMAIIGITAGVVISQSQL